MTDHLHKLSMALVRETAPADSAPTWSTVVEALMALDGCEQTLICLERTGGTRLMIGGGSAGRYVVNCLLDQETQENYLLVNRTPAGPAMELCCGGQTAQYPARHCVDLSLAMEAVDHFCRTGSMAPDLLWEEGL